MPHSKIYVGADGDKLAGTYEYQRHGFVESYPWLIIVPVLYVADVLAGAAPVAPPLHPANIKATATNNRFKTSEKLLIIFIDNKFPFIDIDKNFLLVK
jgi:hypothetical protein